MSHVPTVPSSVQAPIPTFDVSATGITDSVVAMTLLDLPPATHPDVVPDRIEPGPDDPRLPDEESDEPVGTSYPRCADGNGTLTHLFFSDDEFDIARAKAICGKCGLAASCLEGALERAEPYGVWGGQLLVEGAIVAVKRGRGRPPKSPRPQLVVDEVPVPPHLVA